MHPPLGGRWHCIPHDPSTSCANCGRECLCGLSAARFTTLYRRGGAGGKRVVDAFPKCVARGPGPRRTADGTGRHQLLRHLWTPAGGRAVIPPTSVFPTLQAWCRAGAPVRGSRLRHAPGARPGGPPDSPRARLLRPGPGAPCRAGGGGSTRATGPTASTRPRPTPPSDPVCRLTRTSDSTWSASTSRSNFSAGSTRRKGWGSSSGRTCHDGHRQDTRRRGPHPVGGRVPRGHRPAPQLALRGHVGEPERGLGAARAGQDRRRGEGVRPVTAGQQFGLLSPVNEGDSYGSRRGVFCFVAECPPGVLR